MLTSELKQTAEYKNLLAAVAGDGPAAVALFGLPPTARAQRRALSCATSGSTPKGAAGPCHSSGPMGR